MSVFPFRRRTMGIVGFTAIGMLLFVNTPPTRGTGWGLAAAIAGLNA